MHHLTEHCSRYCITAQTSHSKQRPARWPPAPTDGKFNPKGGTCLETRETAVKTSTKAVPQNTVLDVFTTVLRLSTAVLRVSPALFFLQRLSSDSTVGKFVRRFLPSSISYCFLFFFRKRWCERVFLRSTSNPELASLFPRHPVFDSRHRNSAILTAEQCQGVNRAVLLVRCVSLLIIFGRWQVSASGDKLCACSLALKGLSLQCYAHWPRLALEAHNSGLAHWLSTYSNYFGTLSGK